MSGEEAEDRSGDGLRLLALVLVPLAMVGLLWWSIESGALDAFAEWLSGLWFDVGGVDTEGE